MGPSLLITKLRRTGALLPALGRQPWRYPIRPRSVADALLTAGLVAGTSWVVLAAVAFDLGDHYAGPARATLGVQFCIMYLVGRMTNRPRGWWRGADEGTAGG